jgi:hypothetical protein
MKLTTSILTVTAAMMTSGAWAQNPNIINNVQSSMQTVQEQKTNDSNAALGITGKPAPDQSAKPAAVQSTKPTAAQPAKAAASQPTKPATAKPATATAKQATAKPATAKATTSATAAPGKSPFVAVKASGKPLSDPMVKKQPASHPVIVAKEPTLQVVSKTASPDGKNAASAVKPVEAPKPPKPEEKKWAMSGKRDPFFSPVVQQPTGSGCSTGKKCLDIGQINLRGVVRSEGGFIAVVTNSLNKAYFLHENDPVFNGYVMKITGDSVVFSESGQDKLGKPLTREVVKKITTPAV